MKQTLSFLLLITITFCFGQNQLPNDWELNEFKGKIRRVVVDEFHDNPKSSPTKKILNFDKNGFLKTTSEYNTYYVEDDSIVLSHIVTYKNIASKRYFYKYDIEENDTTMTGYFEMVGKNKYALKTDSKGSYKTSSITWTKNGYIIKNNRQIYDRKDEKVVDITVNYNYNEDELLDVEVENNLSDTKEVNRLNIESIKDDKGNIINQIFFNEEGKIYLEIKRKFYYYD